MSVSYILHCTNFSPCKFFTLLSKQDQMQESNAHLQTYIIKKMTVKSDHMDFLSHDLPC